MKQIQIKEVIKTIEEISHYGCNKCGVVTEKEHSFSGNMFHGFHVSFGYGSDHDTDHWEFDLCEDCLFEVVKDFNVAPLGFGVDSYGYTKDLAKDSQENFERWKNNEK